VKLEILVEYIEMNGENHELRYPTQALAHFDYMEQITAQ